MPNSKRFPMPFDLMDRWWLRVAIRDDGCWEWTGARWKRGYGKFCLRGNRRVSAHRWGYEELVGPVPDGMELDHLCRNPSCVNPEHLEPVTHLENVRRGTASAVNGARQRGKTRCPKGHPYDDVNTYYATSGSRNCRACGRMVATRLRQQRRATAA